MTQSWASVPARVSFPPVQLSPKTDPFMVAKKMLLSWFSSSKPWGRFLWGYVPPTASLISAGVLILWGLAQLFLLLFGAFKQVVCKCW